MTHFRKIFKVLFPKFLSRHQFTFCVQILWRTFAGKWAKHALFWWQKCSQNAFFRRHFVPVWWRALNVCRGVCRVALYLPVKFRPNWFRFAGVIPEKWFCTNAIYASAHKDQKNLTLMQTIYPDTAAAVFLSVNHILLCHFIRPVCYAVSSIWRLNRQNCFRSKPLSKWVVRRVTAYITCFSRGSTSHSTHNRSFQIGS